MKFNPKFFREDSVVYGPANDIRALCAAVVAVGVAIVLAVVYLGDA